MAKGANAIIWLILAVVFGLITLVMLGLGGYFTYSTNNKLTAVEKVYADESAELGQLDKNKTRTRVEESRFEELNAEARRTKNANDVNEWRQKRQYSLVTLFASLIPLLVTLRCLFTVGVRMLKKNKDDDEDEDRPRKKKKKGDDDDEEERPAKKKKKGDDGIKSRDR